MIRSMKKRAAGRLRISAQICASARRSSTHVTQAAQGRPASAGPLRPAVTRPLTRTPCLCSIFLVRDATFRLDIAGVALTIRASFAGIAQLVEHDLAKVGVASSSLVSRSRFKQLATPGSVSDPGVFVWGGRSACP